MVTATTKEASRLLKEIIMSLKKIILVFIIFLVITKYLEEGLRLLTVTMKILGMCSLSRVLL